MKKGDDNVTDDTQQLEQLELPIENAATENVLPWTAPQGLFQ